MKFTGCILALIAALASPLLLAGPEGEQGGRFVFSWPFTEDDRMRPRGGTTKGPAVDLVEQATEDFKRIHEPGLSGLERDRRAILAMAGPYRVSFDFLEVVGFAADYEPQRPYQSWATEYIYVIADEPERIVLQHLLVMTVVGEDGERHGPFVNKHWRQEWRYQAKSAHTYRGARTWRHEKASRGESKGRWLQSVWQVDDSPRYAAWGEWRHTADRSTWIGGETWRPLPRREYSVRDDYDALVGTNRHTVLPTGWVQEQRNLKVVLDGPGRIARRLAKEYGVARYERIEDYDFSPGDAYLEATAPFWAEVRRYWGELLAHREVVHLKGHVDQQKLFEPLFERAQAIADGERAFQPEADRRFVRETIDAYLADEARPGEGY